MKFSSACVGTWRKFGTWISLACIVTAFVVAVVRLHPTNFFGYTEDDSIYFSSAKGLAEGKGYVLASFPGTPAATKYPIFYPWLLSWVWRWNPSFPANLTDAIALNVAFGALYILAAYLFLRRFKSIGGVEVLILTAFCALHPVVVFYSGNLLSEIPFAALALGAMLAADSGLQRDSPGWKSVCCGILVGLCMLTRAFAVPVGIGILVAAVVNRAWRPLLTFCTAAAPFFVALCWRTIFPKLPVSPASGPAALGLGWTHTWTYYTSYLNVWKEGVPTFGILLAMLKNNVLVLLSTPALYFVNPSFGRHVFSQQMTVVVLTIVTAAIIAGIVRVGFHEGFRPAQMALPFYVFLILVWNYSQAERFLIPFLPLFAAGLWIETKHVLALVREAISRPRPALEKVFALALSFIICFAVSDAVRNYIHGTRTICIQLSKRRAALAAEKREAYEWLSRETDPDARVVAYEDASLYLYSGRVAIRPFTFTTAEFYDPQLLEQDIYHLTDVSRAVGAKYWVTSEDDYDFEWLDAYRKGHSQMAKFAQVFPVVYRSSSDHVRVYSVGCLQPQASGCESRQSVLSEIERGDGRVEQPEAATFMSRKDEVRKGSHVSAW